MNWYKYSTTMSISDALFELGLSKLPSNENEAKKARNKKALENHPDRGGSTFRMERINSAYSVVLKAISRGSSFEPFQYEDFSKKNQNDIPPWQTDLRGSSSVGKDFSDKNRCLKEIYERSIGNGAVSDFTFWAFDGLHFRGVFTAKTNPQTFRYAARIMEYWNSNGANSYPTVAVLVGVDGGNFRIVRINGKDTWISISSESFNANPGNDRNLVAELKQIISSMSV